MGKPLPSATEIRNKHDPLALTVQKLQRRVEDNLSHAMKDISFKFLN